MSAPAPALGAGHTARLPLTLLALLTPILVFTLVFCKAGRLNWLLEVGPALVGIAALALTYQRLPLSRFVYVCLFLHSLVLIYGGYYTYALTPLGNWAKEAFDLQRNHYDRVGHTALGFFPVFLIKEVLLRVTPLRRGGWFYFLVLSVVMAIAAVYELVEWWSTYLVAGDVGQAFLGSQGDPWDAQWDMFLALVGASAGLLLLGRFHDSSMARTMSGNPAEPLPDGRFEGNVQPR
jgi:putative membrane protein